MPSRRIVCNQYRAAIIPPPGGGGRGRRWHPLRSHRHLRNQRDDNSQCTVRSPIRPRIVRPPDPPCRRRRRGRGRAAGRRESLRPNRRTMRPRGAPPMIRFRCPLCDKTLKAPDGKAGAAVVCPRCQERSVVPAAAAATDADGRPRKPRRRVGPRPVVRGGCVAVFGDEAGQRLGRGPGCGRGGSEPAAGDRGPGRARPGVGCRHGEARGR